MKKLLLSITIIIFSTFLFSCSKEESETTLTGENGGQISRFQLVTVDFGSNTIPNDTYTGTFNNEPITLSKIEDNKLLFYVKESTPLGQTQLLIPALNNTKIIYEVVEATLTQSPEATLQPLMDYQAQYGATLTNAPEDAPFLQNHNAFTQYFADLSDDDRIIAAKFYNTNKAIFDPVYTTNYDAIQGRMANQTQADFDFQLYRSLILRHKLAVAVTVVAGTLAATPPYEPIETGLSIAVALAGIHKSSDFHKQIIEDVFRVVQIKLNNELGINNRLSNAPYAVLSLTDNQATTLPFAVNAKNFSNTDSNVQKEFVQTYFTAKNKLNGFINQLNTAINWINNNVPLLTLSTITTIDVPATTALNSFDTNASLMQRFSFSVNHPNLSLQNATLQSDGQLNLKVKFLGNPTATSISSTLNYTYNDDFSSFSGSFPIEVNSSVSNLFNFSFYDQYDISTCIGPDSFSCNWKLSVSFSGGSPVGGTIFHRTLWDNENDGFFEGTTGYFSASVTNANTSLNNNIYTVNPPDNGYCWGNPNTQSKVEYYYVSPTGVESPHYFSPVPR
ncbi:hypothetical protein [Flavobacterium sp. UBA6195]|uniref:hypothetical protein n=1 Tax=Flavobacterium sp. UBA6195 TaxID=1946554 RepID=UPI0025BCBD45|nr:hypothetical protein [Flavobacterium sp. UBA6195]